MTNPAFQVKGELVIDSASAAASAQKAGAAAKQALGSAFSSLGSVAGGALGPFQSLFYAIESGSSSSASALLKVGVVGTAVGAIFTELGSKETAALNQLKAGIDASGGSFADYKSRVEAADEAGAKFGDSSTVINQALNTLVLKTGDVSNALDLLGLSENVAAARHISLADAAQLVGSAYNGNTRLLKQYGAVVYEADGKTIDTVASLQKLAQVMNGQADAAANTFSGRLKELGTILEDNIAKFGQKFGPAITIASTALTLFVGIQTLLASRASAAALAQLAEQGAIARTGIVADEASAQLALFSAAELGAGTAGIGAAAEMGGVAVAMGGIEVAEAGAAIGGIAMWAAILGPIALAVAALVGVDEGIKKIENVLHLSSGKKNIIDGITDAAIPGKLELDLLDKQLGKLFGHKKSETANSIADLIAKADSAAAATKLLTETQDAYKASLFANVDPANKMSVLLGTLESDQEKLATETDTTKKNTDAYTVAQDKLAIKTQVTTNAQDALTKAETRTGNASRDLQADLVKLGSATSTVDDKVAAFTQALKDESAVAGGDVVRSQDAVQKALNSLAQSLHDGKGALDAYSDAGLANRSAVDSATTSAQAYAAEIFKSTGNITAAEQSYQNYYNALVQTANQQGVSKTQLDSYLQSVGELPGQVDTALTGTADAGTKAADQLSQALQDGLTKALTPLEQDLENLVASMGGAAGPAASGQGGAVGGDLTQGIADGILNGTPTVLGAVQKLSQQMAGASADAFNYDRFVTPSSSSQYLPGGEYIGNDAAGPASQSTNKTTSNPFRGGSLSIPKATSTASAASAAAKALSNAQALYKAQLFSTVDPTNQLAVATAQLASDQYNYATEVDKVTKLQDVYTIAQDRATLATLNAAAAAQKLAAAQKVADANSISGTSSNRPTVHISNITLANGVDVAMLTNALAFSVQAGSMGS